MSHPLGYYGIASNHPAYRLVQFWGDRLESMTANDKLAIITVLSIWLNDGEEIADRVHMLRLLDLFTHGGLNAFTATQTVYQAILLLSGCDDDGEQIMSAIDTDGAMRLMSALIEQISDGVYLSDQQPLNY